MRGKIDYSSHRYKGKLKTGSEKRKRAERENKKSSKTKDDKRRDISVNQ
ncbi:unnamed protein product [marine sediment metagenome]|uniref:Uncharacterized protein n=1 Tax=marine sediment metagenome TaxID=412755 RepID=X1F3N9_9ZZZZ